MHKEVQKVFHRKYFVHAQTVCTRHLLGGEGPGNEARKHHVIDHHGVNNVCPTCDLILPSSPLQNIQYYSQVCVPLVCVVLWYLCS